MSRVKIPQVYCVVDNGYLPVLELEVELGANGSLSTVSGRSSLTLLAASGVDVYQAGQTEEGAAIDVYMGFGTAKHVFSGVLDDFDFDPDEDVITFSGRDNAAGLVDTKETTANINYKNQTIGQIVTQIANRYGLTPKVTDPGLMAGDELWDSSHYMPHGQPPWNMLQDLARTCGYECFVTKKNELFFGPADEAAGDAITVSHGADPLSSPENPVKQPHFKYQPRRNSNVEVEVVSYHPIKGKKIRSSAKVSPLSGRSGSKTMGAFVAKSKSGKQGAKTGGTKPSARPVVTKRVDGLSQEKADAIAESMAKDIAKRQVIFTGICEGLPDAEIHSSLTVKQGRIYLFGFDKLKYIISKVHHKYSMESGYATELTAMTKPEVEKTGK